MTYPREVLNRIKWGGEGLSDVVITYVHRGSPGGIAVISGDDVVMLGRSFFQVRMGYIPYHRIIKIEKDGEIVYRA